MGFRFGWWGKFWGMTWGPKGGWRFYGWTGSKRSGTGCLISLIMFIGASMLIIWAATVVLVAG